MTFSVVARCETSQMLGMAVSSSSPAVAARCVHARAQVGVVASQNMTDPALGQRGLALLAGGANAPETVAILRRTGVQLDYRQLAVVDGSGLTAVFTGAKAFPTAAAAQGVGVACAGNLLANAEVPRAMVAAFEAASGSLGDRLLGALAAGLAAGGETRPVRSAGLTLVREVPWPVAELRVDWSDDPIDHLAELWTLYQPQLDDYVQRALDPAAVASRG
ncbi:MAG: DUF1028 domain-containing protein [Candidatus Competibacterales bacterium]